MSGTLRGVDYANISILLTDEELLVQHTARDFVEAEVLPVSTKAACPAAYEKPSACRKGE